MIQLIFLYIFSIIIHFTDKDLFLGYASLKSSYLRSLNFGCYNKGDDICFKTHVHSLDNMRVGSKRFYLEKKEENLVRDMCFSMT